MFMCIGLWEIMNYIESGDIVSCTDRQKGETFYVNGMVVSDYAELIKAAKADKISRYEFFVYMKKEETSHENS